VAVDNLICALDVGSSKICALIAEVDASNTVRVVGAARVPAAGMRRGVVVNTSEATAAIGQAIAQAEASANCVMEAAFVSISGSHINSVGSKGVVGVGRGGRITWEDTQRALEQARNIALPHNRDVIHVIPRCYAVDDQRGIHDPVGMFGFRLEVDASIITGASSAIANLVTCVQANGVAIRDLVLAPLASAEAVLTDEERRLGVALVDIGAGTADIAIYLEAAPWHAVIKEVAGDHFVRDVVMLLRMPYGKAEALIKEHGHAEPERVPADQEVQCGAFGQTAQQTVRRRLLAEIINARAEEIVDIILLEVKRSGYDGLLPAGIVLTGGVAQLAGFAELSEKRLDWPVRVGWPDGVASSIMDLSSPEYATAVGLLLWGLRQGSVPRVVEPPSSPGALGAKIVKWLRNLLPM